MLEIWDGYNEKEELLGLDLIRGEEIPKGVYHLVVEVLIRHLDGDYLLMQRDFNKDGWSGFYEASAGGSALKGESAELAIMREAFEETGIEPRNLKLINKQITHPIIFYSYLSIVDCDKESVILQEGETIEYKWLNQKDFMKFMTSEECIATQRDRLLPHLNPILNNIRKNSLAI